MRNKARRQAFWNVQGEQTGRVKMKQREKSTLAEEAAQMLFTFCGTLCILAVAAVTFYMIVSGIPAIRRIGLSGILFGTAWNPTGKEPEFGIL